MPDSEATDDSASFERTADFFISYIQSDRLWAEWIASQLESADYSVILQAWDFRPGSNFVVEMDTALRSADRIIAVLSPDYLASRFAHAEMTFAINADPDGRQGKLLPVRVRQLVAEGLIMQRVWIDLVGCDQLKGEMPSYRGCKARETEVRVSVISGDGQWNADLGCGFWP